MVATFVSCLSLSLEDASYDVLPVVDSASTTKGFVLKYPDAVYTCLIANFCPPNQLHICQWNFHFQRLKQGLSTCFPSRAPAPTSSDWDVYQERVMNLIKSFSPGISQLVFLTIVGSITERVHFHCHFHCRSVESFQLMQSFQLGIVQGLKPDFRQVKTTKWLIQRQPYEAIKAQAQVHEVALTSERQELYEGLITNVFVVTEKKEIITAPIEQVLQGSIRALVLETIKAEFPEYHIREEFPNVNKAPTWVTAFVTSVGKWIQPVSQLYLIQSDGSKKLLQTFEANLFLQDLQYRLHARIAQELRLKGTPTLTQS